MPSTQISVGHLGPSLCGETRLTRIVLVLLSAHHVKRSLSHKTILEKSEVQVFFDPKYPFSKEVRILLIALAY